MFFTAVVVWLALKWSENHDSEHNERWLVLIAYMFGLAIGVHLLNLLALFFVAIIVYFKKRDFTLITFSIMGAISVVAFLAIYPFTIQILPGIADGVTSSSYGLIGPLTFILLIGGALGFGIYYTHKKEYRLSNIILVCYAMILIGYSSYAVIFIRSIADPPIDENDPETVEAFVKYLKREQYGSTPILRGSTFDPQIGNINREKEVLFPRRYSPDPRHINFYKQYESDLDFFINYQVNHMYIRYFNWNFIGRAADIQDTGWQSGFSEEKYPDNFASNKYFYIPFLIGLFGFIFHFSTDWRRALAVLVLFIVTGLAIIVFLNQTPYQPRERDYAYVGSFFAFSVWIGLGITGLIDLIKSYINENVPAAAVVVILALIGSPVLMGAQNWDDHDRSNRYVAPDYAYNLLNSLAPNAIVFTNGDNDTFPLWYAQEVEGVRTDVRVVCLSLLNTDWYIKQLRDQWSHESAPLPISLSDMEVSEVTSSLTRWTPQEVSIPVNKEMLKKAFSEDADYKEAIGVKADTSLQIFRTGTDFEIPVDSLDDEVRWIMRGRSFGRDRNGNEINYLQTQDALILDILQTNNWLRPVYFANTVSSNSQLNLQDYFRFEGKAYRIVPKKYSAGPFGYVDPEIAGDRFRNFRFREWDNPDVYFDENIRRMRGNYRYGFTQLADKYIELGEPDSAGYWLKFGENVIPFRSDETEFNTRVLYAYRYSSVGLNEDAIRVAESSEEELFGEITKYYAQYNEIQNRLTSMNEEANEARRNAQVSKRNRILQQMNAMAEDRQVVLTNIGDNLNLLAIVQNIYFNSEAEEKAVNVKIRFSEITNDSFGDQIPLFDTVEQSNSQMRAFGLN
jgi:hypothetical protein